MFKVCLHFWFMASRAVTEDVWRVCKERAGSLGLS